MSSKMLRENTSNRRLIFAAGLVFLLPLFGCGKSGPQRVVVSGEVTFEGRPVGEGKILFVPREGQKLPASATVIKDGKYTIDAKGGVPVGEHRVMITALYKLNNQNTNVPVPDAFAADMNVIQYLPPKYNESSELEVKIEPNDQPIVQDFYLKK